MAGVSTTYIATLVDRVTAPAKAIARSFAGISSAADKASGRTLGSFSQRISAASAANAVALDAMRGKMLDAIAAGYALRRALAGTTGTAADFESTMLDIAQKGDLSDEAMKALGDRIRALAPTINQTAGEAAKSMDALMGLGLDQGRSEKALSPIGRAAAAYKADLEDVSRASFAVIDNLKVAPEALPRALDAMAQSGKEGAFELKDMAREFPALTASAAALEMRGVDAVTKLSAALQIARKGAGDSSQAANNVANLMQKVVAPDSVKKFKKLGIDIRKELKQVQATGGDVFEWIAGAVQRATKGDLSKIGDVFQDSEVQKFLRPLIQGLDEYKRIRDAAKGADGVVDKDFARRMATAEAQTKALYAGLNALGLSIGTILLPSMNELTGGLLGLARQAETFTQANPALVGAAVKTAAGLVALKVAATGAGFAYRYMKGGALAAMAGVAATGSGAKKAGKMLVLPFTAAGTKLAGIFQTIALRHRLMMATMAAGSIGSGAVLAGVAATGTRALMALLSPIKLVTAAMKGLKYAMLGTGIGAALVAIGAAATFVYRNIEGIKKGLKSFGAAFKGAITPETATAFKPLIDGVSSVARFLDDITGKIDDKKWEAWGKSAGEGAAKMLNDMRAIADAVNAVVAGLGKIADWYNGPAKAVPGLSPEDELPGLSHLKEPSPSAPAQTKPGIGPPEATLPEIEVHADPRSVPLPPARPPGVGALQRVPLPPMRPEGLGTIAPKADASGINSIETAADGATQKLSALGGISVSPTVNAGSITAAEAAVDRLSGKLAALGSQMVGLGSQAANLGANVGNIRARAAANPSLGDGDRTIAG